MQTRGTFQGGFIVVIAVLLTTGIESGLCAQPSAAGSRPNVLFLFADDMTHEAIRAAGKTDIDTPNDLAHPLAAPAIKEFLS